MDSPSLLVLHHKESLLQFLEKLVLKTTLPFFFNVCESVVVDCGDQIRALGTPDLQLLKP